MNECTFLTGNYFTKGDFECRKWTLSAGPLRPGGEVEEQECPCSLNSRAPAKVYWTAGEPRDDATSPQKALEWGVYTPFPRGFFLQLNPDHDGGSCSLGFLPPLPLSWADTDVCHLKWMTVSQTQPPAQPSPPCPLSMQNPYLLGFLSLRALRKAWDLRCIQTLGSRGQDPTAAGLRSFN